MGSILTPSGFKQESIKFLDFASRQIYKEVEVVYIEGGLGAQLLGAFEYLTKIEFKKNKDIVANLDYFKNENLYINSENTFWKWGLTHYGIEPTFFTAYSEKSEFLKHRKNRLKTWATPDYWNFVRKELVDIFKIDEIRVKKVLEKYNVSTEYMMLHVRRGDYVKVAARIMSHEENLNLIKQIRPMLGCAMFVVSDDAFDEDIKNLYRMSTDKEVIFLDGNSEPDYVIHDLRQVHELNF